MSKFTGMEANLNDASQLLKSLANPTRLMILCTLTDGEKSVNELVRLLELQQSTVSQNLSRLRLDRLVKTRRDAQTIYYSLEEGPAEDVISVLYDHYCADQE